MPIQYIHSLCTFYWGIFYSLLPLLVSSYLIIVFFYGLLLLWVFLLSLSSSVGPFNFLFFLVFFFSEKSSHLSLLLLWVFFSSWSSSSLKHFSFLVFLFPYSSSLLWSLLLIFWLVRQFLPLDFYIYSCHIFVRRSFSPYPFVTVFYSFSWILLSLSILMSNIFVLGSSLLLLR